MLSTLFSKANRAIITIVILLLIYNTFKFKNLKSYSSDFLLWEGIQTILYFHIYDLPKWSKIWKPAFETKFSMGIIMSVLLLYSFINLLVALYVDKVWPGQYGVPEKWYFPFTTKFWTGKADPINEIDLTNFEAEPPLRIGIRAINLRKEYEKNMLAVKGLTLDMFENEITVFLGRNGAGKTSVISMLAGILAPTLGTAIINGHDIRTDLIKARSSIGVCLQNNVLFDELTVREHIIFYSQLKGLTAKAAHSEMVKYVSLLELEPVCDVHAQKLSGGTKRKLSIALAFCGGSKIVLCDEPTISLDPATRHKVWNLLQNEKKGRTILLTTHFMDEAEVLGNNYC